MTSQTNLKFTDRAIELMQNLPSELYYPVGSATPMSHLRALYSLGIRGFAISSAAKAVSVIGRFPDAKIALRVRGLRAHQIADLCLRSGITSFIVRDTHDLNTLNNAYIAHKNIDIIIESFKPRGLDREIFNSVKLLRDARKSADRLGVCYTFDHRANLIGYAEQWVKEIRALLVAAQVAVDIIYLKGNLPPVSNLKFFFDLPISYSAKLLLEPRAAYFDEELLDDSSDLESSVGPVSKNADSHEQQVPTPPQETSSTTYGINLDGRLDRLPHKDQKALRDEPDQRRAYEDLRQVATELKGENQRLGPRLERALDRMIRSLPENFDEAEAYLVWRDANSLRRLYLAHREASKNPDYDEAKLEPVIGEQLGGFLDLYNHFAYFDDGLRAKDEARIPPQERPKIEVEAEAASAVVQAILESPQLTTENARNDLAISVEQIAFSDTDPYHEQTQSASNATVRNAVAAALSAAASAISNPKVVGAAAAGGIVTGAASVIGKAAMTAVLATNFDPVMLFISGNVEILRHYIMVAFPSFDHLPILLDKARELWKKMSGIL